MLPLILISNLKVSLLVNIKMNYDEYSINVSILDNGNDNNDIYTKFYHLI